MLFERARLPWLVIPVCLGFMASCGSKDGEEHKSDQVSPEGTETSESTAPVESQPTPMKTPKVVKKLPKEPRAPEPTIPTLADDVLVITIPAQTLLVGSATGSAGRDPASELDLAAYKIESFSIDRYPYPNQKGVVPRTGVTADEAEGLCEAAGKRLCTELEWEAACKGGVGSVYPYSQSYDSSMYGKGFDVLTSGYGVAGMGAMQEWTDSLFAFPENPVPRGQVIKGAQPESSKYDRRCADRGYRMADKSSSLVTFRCCSGTKNDAELKLGKLEKPFSEVQDMDSTKLGQLVNAIPELKRVHGEPAMFGETDLDYVLLRRNIDPRKSYAGYIFTNKPIWWHPMRGEELFAFSGYTGDHSFVAALYHLGEGRFKHAASMIVLGNTNTSIKVPLPVILIAGVDRDVLNWGPCWNCSEGGAFYVEDETNVIQVSHRW